VAIELELVRRAVRQVNRLRPRFVVVTGDMVNAWPGSRRFPGQVRAFREAFRGLDPGIPLFTVPGNHDISNRPTRSRLARYRAIFGEDRYTFWVGGVCFVVLNSTLLSAGSIPEETRRQSRWLTRTLREARARVPQHLVVFQHHPWFLFRVEEPDSYFNLPRRLRGPVLSRMNRAGVRAIFAGHYHHNASARFEDIELVTSGSISRPLLKPDSVGRRSRDPAGLRIVWVTASDIDHRFYGLDDVPSSVALPGEGVCARDLFSGSGGASGTVAALESGGPQENRRGYGGRVPSTRPRAGRPLVSPDLLNGVLALIVIGLAVRRRRASPQRLAAAGYAAHGERPAIPTAV